MIRNFNLPCVDNLREGIDYRLVEWDFASQQPSRTPGTPCPPGEKVVFGVCRKVGDSGEKDFDSEKKTSQESQLEEEATRQGKKVSTKEEATAANVKGFETGGKKYGWAIKNGKPVIVEWGSVAGTKKKGKEKTTAPEAPAAATTTPAPK